MQAISDYLAMGGYAAYVWPAFAVTTVVMLGLWLISGAGWRGTVRTLAALQRGRQDRAGSGPADA